MIYGVIEMGSKSQLLLIYVLLVKSVLAEGVQLLLAHWFLLLGVLCIFSLIASFRSRLLNIFPSDCTLLSIPQLTNYVIQSLDALVFLA
jgi:hypothetical protein